MTSTIILPRSVVEQALQAIYGLLKFNTTPEEYAEGRQAKESLRAALERPKPLPSTVWRFVPTTMTDAMAAVDKELRHAVPWVRWEAILAAAPQPPRQPLTDEQIDTMFGNAEIGDALAERVRKRNQEIYWFGVRDAEAVHGIKGDA